MSQRMMWKKGRRNHNISSTLKIKKVLKINTKFETTKTTNGPKIQDIASIAEKGESFLGNNVENWYAYEELADYKGLVLKRITTKIKNFQVHRIVMTKIGTGPKAQLQEDKVTITDPIIMFYRQTDGKTYPGGITGGQFEEICKKKCIRSCNDGWYWTTKFRNKHDRKMTDAQKLRSLMLDMSSNPMRGTVLQTLGAENRGFDPNDYDDVHSMKFAIAREQAFPPDWYTKSGILGGTIERECIDFVTFDMVTWITIKLFRKVQ